MVYRRLLTLLCLFGSVLHFVTSFGVQPVTLRSSHGLARHRQESHGGALLQAQSVSVTNTAPPDIVSKSGKGPGALFESLLGPKSPTERVAVCVIGGGVSGLTASRTVAEEGLSVSLLEASDKCGGRVRSDITDDGFILDRGFAVFIEEYPIAKQLLDYDKLKLGKFLPGCLLKINERTELARVSDPLREPPQLFNALVAPVGSFMDKIKLLPLILHVSRKSIEELFDEPETDTLTALKERWGFSDVIIERFFQPFYEGIFFAPLQSQSSRMFAFVFKMFSTGAATLPRGGMAAVADQLAEKATNAGADVRAKQSVSDISRRDDGKFVVQTADGTSRIEADSVIVATDVRIARQLLSQLPGLDSMAKLPDNPQGEVGCVYYVFEGPAPVTDPILIINGIGVERGDLQNPINSVCFPSHVNEGYAPAGFGLCSASVLKATMKAYQGREEDLDQAARQQLATWFPEYAADIKSKWQLKKIYYIPNGQPLQFGVMFPASINGGRKCNEFQGNQLPSGLFVCGDHMATASLNGALESGLDAGKAATSYLQA